MQAEIERMNQMLRDTGYGQGQIDAYADQCEEIDRLREFKRLVHSTLDYLGIDKHQDKECRIRSRLSDLESSMSREKREWIPVPPAPGGRMPTEEDGDIDGLVLARMRRPYTKIHSCHHTELDPDDYSHWMPLPAPCIPSEPDEPVNSMIKPSDVSKGGVNKPSASTSERPRTLSGKGAMLNTATCMTLILKDWRIYQIDDAPVVYKGQARVQNASWEQVLRIVGTRVYAVLQAEHCGKALAKGELIVSRVNTVETSDGRVVEGEFLLDMVSAGPLLFPDRDNVPPEPEKRERQWMPDSYDDPDCTSSLWIRVLPGDPDPDAARELVEYLETNEVWISCEDHREMIAALMAACRKGTAGAKDNH